MLEMSQDSLGIAYGMIVLDRQISLNDVVPRRGLKAETLSAL